MEEERRCDNCGEIIGEDDDFLELDDGTILCEECREEYDECVMCGKICKIDDMFPWGDECRICESCLEEQCPSFDSEENEKETARAYEAMKARYLGRVSSQYADETVELTYDTDDPCVHYTLSVTFDDEGVITDISRLTAEMTLSEWVNGTDTREYPISEEDYDSLADNMFSDEGIFDD